MAEWKNIFAGLFLAVGTFASVLSAQRLDTAAFIAAAIKTPDHVRPWTVYPNIHYGSDSAQIMDILVPNTPGNHATIVLIHGGGWDEGDKRDLQGVGRRFALDGFTVANINYRLATPTSNHYPAGLDDTKSAVDYLEQNSEQYQVDRGRVVALGTSAGANLALQLGMERRVNAVVDFYGPTNFVDPVFLEEENGGKLNSDVVETYFGCTFIQDPGLYFHASPINEVTGSMAPTILLQGEDDTVVPVEQSIDFYNVLEALGVTAKLQVYPTLGHGFLNNEPSPDPYLSEAERFLAQVLTLPTTN